MTIVAKMTFQVFTRLNPTLVDRRRQEQCFRSLVKGHPAQAWGRQRKSRHREEEQWPDKEPLRAKVRRPRAPNLPGRRRCVVEPSPGFERQKALYRTAGWSARQPGVFVLVQSGS